MNEYFGESPEQARMKELEQSVDDAKLDYQNALNAGDQEALDAADSTWEKAKRSYGDFQAAYPDIKSTTYKDILERAYGEESAAKEKFLDTAQGAYNIQDKFLTNIIDKQVAGQAVGPYGQDIDTLLAQQADVPWTAEMQKLAAEDPRVNELLKERMGVSFGGGSPIKFMTGAQQRAIASLVGGNAAKLGTLSGERSNYLNNFLASQSNNLKTLTGAQSEGLKDLTNMASQRVGAQVAPAQARFELFNPTDQAQIGYLQDMWSKLKANEALRYGTPSTTTTQTQDPGTAEKINTLGNFFNLASNINWGT